MRDDAFHGAVAKIRLLQLIHFGFERRHRIIVERRDAFRAWFGSLSPDLAEQCEAALDWSIAAEAREPSEHELLVDSSGEREAHLSVSDAITTLGLPFIVCVENEESDRAFIECVASEINRRRLRELLRHGWVVFRSLGGISKIPTLIDTVLRDDSGARRRLFAVFDSDARGPAEPHNEAVKTDRACESRGVERRMLGRRAIENYLPRRAIEEWARADEQKAMTRTHLDRIEALYHPWFDARARRHHFDMKRGFGNLAGLHAIYDGCVGLDTALRARLTNGFGGELATAFRPEWVREEDLRAEQSWDEVSELIERILVRAR